MAVAQPIPVTDSIYEKAARLLSLRSAKEIRERQVKEINKDLDITEQELTDLMIAQEIGKFPHNGVTIYLSNKLYASCPVANRQGLRSYLVDNGQGQILVDTVDDKALTKYVKGLLDESDQLPPELSECITVFEKPSVCIRKQNQKGEKNDG